MMIIGTRTLTVATPAGDRPVIIRVFEPTADGPAWDCSYEIDWPEGTVKSHASRPGGWDGSSARSGLRMGWVAGGGFWGGMVCA